MPMLIHQPAAREHSHKPRRISRTHKPQELGLGEWQVALRRQVAEEQAFEIRNLGAAPVFSEFAVANPATKRTYRVAVRGEGLGVNYCSCPDYAVNTLGTCKHIEAVLQRLRRRHAAELHQGHRPPFSEVYIRYGAQRTVMFSLGTDAPPSLRSAADRCFDVDGRIKPSGFDAFDQFLRQASRLDPQFRIYDDAASLIAEVRDAHARDALLREKYDCRNPASVWKKLLKTPLHPYQRQGALFVARAGRAILADDMGLGKTIQAIAAADILAREYGIERVLIVCPTSLKNQWAQEIDKFCERPALIVEGMSDRRRELYQQDQAFFKITNYDVVHRDLEAIRGWEPDFIILDEAQRIKNWQTRTAKSVKQLESRYALVLTGTPLENRLEELHSIVEFVDRHRLGPLFAFKAAHEVCEEDSSKVVGYRDLDQINKTLAPILIRRTKKEVLDQLPDRLDKNFFVPMTDPQWVPHRENQEIVARLVAKWRRYKFLTEADQIRLRIALQYMRMSCDSTYLIDKETRHGTKVDELSRLLEEIFERPDNKVVIFSQWVRMNELVGEMLDGRKWGYVHLHGGVPGKRRQDLTRALREDDKCRVFLSTDAGGVGLNLQAASTVINMDLPWNPAVLEQRIGRVHRMGQRRPVRVVNFISESTIEHGMLSLLSFKKSLFAGVLDGASDRVFMGDSALNRFMKTVETAATSIPQAVATPAEGPEDAGGDGASAAASATAQGRRPGQTAAAPADASIQTLGQLLATGAAFLQDLGKVLADPEARHAADSPPRLAARVEREPATGRPELRIALPDEQTLQGWMTALAGFFGGLRR